MIRGVVVAIEPAQLLIPDQRKTCVQRVQFRNLHVTAVGIIVVIDHFRQLHFPDLALVLNTASKHRTAGSERTAKRIGIFVDVHQCTRWSAVSFCYL
jgi:hypothetical protein